MRFARCTSMGTLALAVGLLVFSLWCPALSQAALYSYSDFSGGLGPDFTFWDSQGVFTLDTSSSGLRLTKADGTGSGFTKGEIEWNRMLVGNFTVDVDYTLNQPLTNGQQQELHIWSSSGPYFLIVRSNELGDNYHVWTHEAFLGRYSTSDTSGTLRITRTGTTMDTWFKSPDAGSFTHVYGESGFPSGDLYFSMTLQNQGYTTASLDGSFGNIRINDGAPVPLPQTWLLFAPGLAGLAALRRRFRK